MDSERQVVKAFARLNKAYYFYKLYWNLTWKEDYGTRGRIYDHLIKIYPNDPFRLYAKDKQTLKNVLVKSAHYLAAESRRNMIAIRHQISDRYLNGKYGNQTAELEGFSRALSAYMTYTTVLPHAMIFEDYDKFSEMFRTSEKLDPVNLRSQRLPSDRWSLQFSWNEWFEWDQSRNPHEAYARYLYGAASQDELKIALLGDGNMISTLPPTSGHPLITLVGRFKKPLEAYQILVAPVADRNQEILKLIREIKQHLLEGQLEYERALSASDWGTLKPLLLASKNMLFHRLKLDKKSNIRYRDQGIRELCDEIVDDLEGWTIKDTFSASVLVASLALAVVSFGTSTAAATTIMRVAGAALEATEFAVNLIDTAIENRQRARINRFAMINQALHLASDPEKIAKTAAVLVVAMLLPGAVIGAARRLRQSYLSKVLAEPDDALDDIATESSKEVVQNRANNRELSSQPQQVMNPNSSKPLNQSNREADLGKQEVRTTSKANRQTQRPNKRSEERGISSKGVEHTPKPNPSGSGKSWVNAPVQVMDGKTQLVLQKYYKRIYKRIAGTGLINRIWARELADGQLGVTIEGLVQPELLARTKRGVSSTRRLAPNFNRQLAMPNIFGPVGDLNFPAKVERLHLFGPRFGDEAVAGIMLGPASINRSWQGQAEYHIQELAKEAVEAGGVVKLRAKATAWPDPTPKGFSDVRGEPWLQRAEYEFQMQLPDGSLSQTLLITIDVPDPGLWTSIPGRVSPESFDATDLISIGQR